ncbi:RssA protein [Aggregatibacter actinomycetemcomitans]|nr:RssA protein [Aggregatibacter actinomycetemcomitans]QEH48199.1 RssA protein [Aggregatibacter actinomycetemcomitans]QEH48747.1 RssA protein [Aggregatibacter actinomycetemcomitans]TYA49784.1 RssA protein [Aggregatibacter actinomycetemcomitans]TYA52056.1 RssA protein [Aggregatibacter actinomycetemcomitans]
MFGVNLPSKQKGRVTLQQKYLNDKRCMGFHSLFTTRQHRQQRFHSYQLPFELDIFDQDEFARAGIDFSCFRGVGIYRCWSASDKSLSISPRRKIRWKPTALYGIKHAVILLFKNNVQFLIKLTKTHTYQ